jgi:hypothetical protein
MPIEAARRRGDLARLSTVAVTWPALHGRSDTLAGAASSW